MKIVFFSYRQQALFPARHNLILENLLRDDHNSRERKIMKRIFREIPSES